MNERQREASRIRRELNGEMKPYTGIFEGVPALRSKLPDYVLPVVDIYVHEGRFTQIPQGEDFLISLNERTQIKG